MLDWAVRLTRTSVIPVREWAQLAVRKLASLVAVVGMGDATSTTPSRLVLELPAGKRGDFLGALIVFGAGCHCWGGGGGPPEAETAAKDFLVGWCWGRPSGGGPGWASLGWWWCW